MEALRICNTGTFPCAPAPFLKPSSPPTTSLPAILSDRGSRRLHSPGIARLRVAASPSNNFSDVEEAEKRTVASEKAVEGESAQLHETARKASHAGVGLEQVKHVEDAADAVSEEASARASSPSSTPLQSDGGNPGDGHEEGLGAAEKMTPKP